MRTLLLLGLLSAPLLVHAADNALRDASKCEFDGVTYFHRWAENDQHEYTPKGQEDLERWSDMITINLHRTTTDGDALANVANHVLENYKRAGGRVLRTDSTPRKDTKPAEHFVAAFFGRPTMIEVAFARFKLVDGIGCVIVYSHREYGEKVGDRVSVWLQANGPNIETALRAWDDFPRPQDLAKEAAKSDAGEVPR